MRDLELVLKAAGDPTRTRILKLLESGGLCVCQVQAVLGLAPSTVSKHLSILKTAGLVEDRRDGDVALGINMGRVTLTVNIFHQDDIARVERPPLAVRHRDVQLARNADQELFARHCERVPGPTGGQAHELNRARLSRMRDIEQRRRRAA